jgi:chromosomal replication initiator protein
MSAKRSKEIVYPRQIVMYLCRTMTETGLQNIGKALGGRDHTTILHGIKTISADLEKNPSLQNTIDILKKKISPQ